MTIVGKLDEHIIVCHKIKLGNRIYIEKVLLRKILKPLFL